MTDKQKAAELILDVLIEKMNIQDAIKAFPRDDENETLECAFHALLHYEADEDIRAKDIEYADVQVEYLENIAELLRNNESLPRNIIAEYREYYEKAPVLSKKGFKNILKQLFRFTL